MPFVGLVRSFDLTATLEFTAMHAAAEDGLLPETDQISTLVSYARDNLGVEKEQMIGMLDLPENFEDLTFPDSKL